MFLFLQKCSHMIATCNKLQLVNFDNVAMDVPIEPNRKRGRPKATVRALLRQRESLREARGIENGSDEEEKKMKKMKKSTKRTKKLRL